MVILKEGVKMKKYIGLLLLLLSLVSGAYARPFVSVESGIIGAAGGKTKRIPMASYGYYEDISGSLFTAGIPITISIGYLKEKSFGDGFGVSLFYTKNIISDATVDTIHNESLTGENFGNNAQITSQQVGVGFIYKIARDFAFNLGISKDMGSKVVYPIKNDEIERKINGIYMPLSLDGGWQFENFGLYMTIGTRLQLSGEEYITNYFFLGLKASYLISW